MLKIINSKYLEVYDLFIELIRYHILLINNFKILYELIIYGYK